MKKSASMVSNGLIMVPDISIEYRGYQIEPKKDFWVSPYQDCFGTHKKGYLITDGCCNLMPGATWAKSVIEAKAMIDCLIEAKFESSKFWELLRERQGLAEWEEI